MAERGDLVVVKTLSVAGGGVGQHWRGRGRRSASHDRERLLFRYDAVGGHIASGRVPSEKGTCQQLTMTTTSGTTVSALVKVV